MTVKRVLLFLVIVIALVAIVSVVSAETYTVNPDIDKLNVRSQYDSSVILGGIRGGRKVEIDYHDKYWGYFTYDGTPAKVYMDYLIPSTEAAPQEGTTTPTPTSSSSPSKKTSKKSEPVYATIDEAAYIYYVTDSIRSHINVRDAKSENATIIGKLQPGEKVYVLNMGKTWTRIVYDNRHAFVYTKYLVDGGDNLPDGGELYRVKVKKNTTLNVRVGADKKTKSIKKLSNGAYVKVFEQYDSWSFIYYNMNDFGYVMNKFLVKVDE